jgi:hypothetical protein
VTNTSRASTSPTKVMFSPQELKWKEEIYDLKGRQFRPCRGFFFHYASYTVFLHSCETFRMNGSARLMDNDTANLV